MDSTRRPTGCPCGEGILNKPKNGTSCHLPANRKFLFHAHFSLQKDFFSNFLSPWFMYFVTESSCFHLVLNLISKEQQKGKIFQFKKIICLQRGGASCSIIWELDVYSFCQLTTGPLSELVAHCWYLLIIFSIPTCRWEPTTSHDYQAETTVDASVKRWHLFPHVLQLRLLRRKRWHIFPIFALLYKLPPNYYRSASVKQGANICFGLPPIAISPKLSKISPPKYFERNTAPSPRYGHRWSHRKDWK